MTHPPSNENDFQEEDDIQQEDNHQELEVYLSASHPCGYLPDLMGATLYVNPELPMDETHYQYLLSIGFRRSGTLVYRPWCAGCAACIPVRVPVDHFRMTRSFRRVLKHNQDLTVHIEEPAFTEERFNLYERYLNSRHGEGPMAHPKPEEFAEFLHNNWGRVHFVDFRLQGRLLMTAVVDQLPNALSAVYTFFDPAEQGRSLGSQAILWEIAKAREMGKSWLYLGYWIANAPKMQYKARFQPLEAYIMREWTPLESN
ncbi:MAG: arginyltransferase [Magnetococcus sp. YQC-5]